MCFDLSARFPHLWSTIQHIFSRNLKALRNVTKFLSWSHWVWVWKSRLENTGNSNFKHKDCGFIVDLERTGVGFSPPFFVGSEKSEYEPWWSSHRRAVAVRMHFWSPINSFWIQRSQSDWQLRSLSGMQSSNRLRNEVLSTNEARFYNKICNQPRNKFVLT